MFLYHINIGYPVLDEGSKFLAPIKHTIWASHEDDLNKQEVGYYTMPAPQKNFHEQVYEHAIVADHDGTVPIALVNPGFNNNQGLGLLIEFNKNEFPYVFEWQNLQEGSYALAIEPSSNHVLGKPFARERDELRWIEHGESYEYTTRFQVLSDNDEISTAKYRINNICQQTEDEFPVISGNWDD